MVGADIVFTASPLDHLLVTASFTYAALWLFFNIKYEHRDKKWFKLLFSGKEWTPLMQSMEILTQLEAVEEEKPGP